MSRVFIDTNVLLDVLGNRQPWAPDAQAVWALVDRQSIAGYISADSFSTVYYIARKLLGGPAARNSLHLLRGSFTTVPCDEHIIDQALAATDFADFEDAVQYFSAVAVNADCILTRDLAGFPRATPPVMTPTAFLATHSL